MIALQKMIVWLSAQLHPLTIIALIVLLNISWTVTLNMMGIQFMATGAPLLDLQNVAGILPTGDAVALIAQYTPAAKTLYWSFFILDNIMPPLVFGAFSLLWAYYLRRNSNRVFDRLLNSTFLLIPLGVGVFDWIENLFFITAISSYPGDVYQAMELGLIFVRLKAVCLFATFMITFALTGYHLVASARRMMMRTPRTAAA